MAPDFGLGNICVPKAAIPHTGEQSTNARVGPFKFGIVVTDSLMGGTHMRYLIQGFVPFNPRHLLNEQQEIIGSGVLE